VHLINQVNIQFTQKCLQTKKCEIIDFVSNPSFYTIAVRFFLSKALEDQPPIPEPLTDSAQLKHFAREAEVNDNYELATSITLITSYRCLYITPYMMGCQ
jgi:hypothetical protein